MSVLCRKGLYKNLQKSLFVSTSSVPIGRVVGDSRLHGDSKPTFAQNFYNNQSQQSLYSKVNLETAFSERLVLLFTVMLLTCYHSDCLSF